MTAPAFNLTPSLGRPFLWAAYFRSSGIAVDNAGARAQAGQSLDDQREAAGEIVAGTAVEPHLRAGLAANDTRKPSCLILCSQSLPGAAYRFWVGGTAR